MRGHDLEVDDLRSVLAGLEKKEREEELQFLAEVEAQANADPHLQELQQQLSQQNRDVVSRAVVIGDCCQYTCIEQSDLPFSITLPGLYKLKSDLTFAPATSNSFAIRVLADNVTIDLCDHTITQTNTITGARCIQLGTGTSSLAPQVVSNVTVKNGSIVGFTGFGVFASNQTMNPPATPLYYDTIQLLNLNVLKCGLTTSTSARAIYFTANGSYLGDSNTIFAHKNINISNCKVNNCFGRAAIFVFNGDGVVIENCQANNLSSTANINVFSYNINSWNVKMNNCQGNGVRSYNSTGQAGGINALDSVGVYIKDCQFNDAYGDSSSIVNSNLSNCHDFVAENCQFNKAGGGENSSIVAGVHASDDVDQTTSINGMKFINCQFNGAYSSSNRSAGGVFMITTRNVVFENCQACNIHVNQPNRRTHGFYVFFSGTDPAFPFANVNNITFLNCIASDISGQSEVIGFNCNNTDSNHTPNQGSTVNYIYKNCIAEQIYSTSSTAMVAGFSEGLRSSNSPFGPYPKLQNLFIENCRVSNVRSNSQQPSPLSAGIVVQSVTNPELSNNSVADCDRGILFAGLDGIHPNVFQLAATKEDALLFPPVSLPLEENFIPLPGLSGAGSSSDPYKAKELEVSMNGSEMILVRFSKDIIFYGGVDAVYFYLRDLTITNPAVGPILYPLDAATDRTYNDTDSFTASGLTFTVYSNSVTNVPNKVPWKVVALGDVSSPTKYSGDDNGRKVLFAGEQEAYSSSSSGNSKTSYNNNVTGIYIKGDGNASRTYTFKLELRYSIEDGYDFLTVSRTSFAPGDNVSNVTRGNMVTVNDVNNLGFLTPAENLTLLNWEAGDQLLLDGKTYYAIVYRPGFVESGLVKGNKVSKCSVAGYQDDRCKTTSAWLSNVGFCNGLEGDNNYQINWCGCPPVRRGTLCHYPKPKYYTQNVAIAIACKKCKK
jgi:hypothetical protein